MIHKGDGKGRGHNVIVKGIEALCQKIQVESGSLTDFVQVVYI